jgi:hypothetical protein
MGYFAKLLTYPPNPLTTQGQNGKLTRIEEEN